jgi:hypothetical protein
MQLKAKWLCTEHQGESGGVGYCYVSPTREHVGLNNCHLKIWASAVVCLSCMRNIMFLTHKQAAYDATKNEPPNTVDFDGVRDGHLQASKPHGRNTSHAQGNATTEATSLLMAIMPLITGISQKRLCSPSLDTSLIRPPTTPLCGSQEASVPLSPLPASGSKLWVCLSDFIAAMGINLTGCEDSLMVLEFTPDIIPDIPVAHLCEIMGAVEGHLWKLQTFCKDWNNCLLAKKAQMKRWRIE